MATKKYTPYKPIDGFAPYEPEAALKYTKFRWWLGITLGDMFDKATELYPNKEALVGDRVRLSYAQLRDKVDKLAIGFIKLGIEPADRVLLQLPNWGEFVYAYFALQKIGAIVVLMLPRHTQMEINHLAHLTEAKAWIVPEQYRKIDYLPVTNDVLSSSSSINYVISARGQGRGIFTGYFKSDNRGLFTKDGFLKTGDLARIDEKGRIKITGRIKDIILRGGENISAVEIEELIMAHPAVEDVSVIGMPDKDLGERVCAYIKPVPGQKPTLEEIVSYMKSKGASVLQLPERIEFIDEIPLTKAGKHDKKVLREDIKKRLDWLTGKL